MKPWVLILLLHSSQIMACCSQNKGICGDKCCDGTLFSKIDCGHSFIGLPTVIGPNVESIKSPSKWLYIWTDPNTNKPHLSGKFPLWYRNHLYPENYPRVLVYDEYNRLIDDTGTKTSKQDELNLRQQAITNLQQQYKHKQAIENEANKKAKQDRLKYLLAKWSKTGIIGPELKQTLAEQVSNKNVTLAMTEKQVIQVWGSPASNVEEVVDGKTKKMLIYKQGQVILLDDIVKSVKKTN